LHTILSRIDLLQDKLNEQERKLNTLSKPVEQNNNNSHHKKQDIEKLEYIVDKKMTEILNSYVDRKMFETKFNELELKIKGISTISSLRSINTQQVKDNSS